MLLYAQNRKGGLVTINIIDMYKKLMDPQKKIEDYIGKLIVIKDAGHVSQTNDMAILKDFINFQPYNITNLFTELDYYANKIKEVNESLRSCDLNNINDDLERKLDYYSSEYNYRKEILKEISKSPCELVDGADSTSQKSIKRNTWIIFGVCIFFLWVATLCVWRANAVSSLRYIIMEDLVIDTRDNKIYRPYQNTWESWKKGIR